MDKKNVLFVINPISGGKKKEHLPLQIDQILDKSKFEHETIFTEYPGHAAEITARGGYEWYISVGGDGTLNEVARNLVFSKSAMGILPLGSGNGLARHVGIDMNVSKAIAQLNTAKEILMDTVSINGKTFVNMGGIGFDAHIGKVFAESKERGFKTYLVKTLTEYNQYRPERYKLQFNGTEIETNAFLISFANSSQYGNDAFIAPDADIQDGLVDVCMMQPFKAYNIPGIGFRLFNKTIKQSKYVKTILTSELIVERASEGAAHLDGEPMIFGKRLEIKVVPASLRLMVP